MKSILPLLVTSEITIFIFTVSKNGLFMNSGLKVLLKRLKCSIRFIALNDIWSNFPGTKLRFHPILCPLNTLNKTK